MSPMEAAAAVPAKKVVGRRPKCGLPGRPAARVADGGDEEGEGGVPVALAGAVGVTRPEDHADDSDEVGDGDEEAGAEDREAEAADHERSPEADGVEPGGGAEVGEREGDRKSTRLNSS